MSNRPEITQLGNPHFGFSFGQSVFWVRPLTSVTSPRMSSRHQIVISSRIINWVVDLENALSTDLEIFPIGIHPHFETYIQLTLPWYQIRLFFDHPIWYFRDLVCFLKFQIILYIVKVQICTVPLLKYVPNM